MTGGSGPTDGADDRLQRLRQAMVAVSSGQHSPDEALAGLGHGFDPVVESEHESDAIVPFVATTKPHRSDAGPATRPTGGSGELIAAEPGRRTGPGRSSWGRPRSGSDAPAADGGPAPGEPRTEQQWETLARAVVLRRLSVKARTRRELADSLAEAEVPESIADRILDRMTDVGLVDDVTFARDWVAARQERKHLSRRVLLDELRGKGIDPVVAEEAVGGVGEGEEYDAALELARRKLGTLSQHPYEVQRRRLAGALERRGFSGTIVRRVLDQTLVDVP